jgi:endonuclease YncB( thermonuclease family)
LAAGLLAVTISGNADGAVFETARVEKVVDGDTARVTTTTGQFVTVRFSGMDSMETGRCNALPATRFMRKLINREQVRLSGTNPASVARGRLVRYVEVLNDGRWVDVQRVSLRQGHAVPLFFKGETTRWRSYMAAAQRARRDGLGIWDDDRCGAGPSAGAGLRLWINYDGDGDEKNDLNSEWVRILNTGPTSVDLSTWWIRSGNHEWFVFPSGSVVAPGEYTTVYVGTGVRSGSDHYWGNSTLKFPNLINPDPLGGGAYLFDPDGDIRASAMYPCLVWCGEQRSASLDLEVNYDSPGPDTQVDPNGEYVVIKNRTAAPVDISYTVLQSAGSTLEMPGGTIVEPWGDIVVHVGSGTDTDSTLFWGQPKAILANGGGAVFLRTTESTTIVCESWGSGRCPTV